MNEGGQRAAVVTRVPFCVFCQKVGKLTPLSIRHGRRLCASHSGKYVQLKKHGAILDGDGWMGGLRQCASCGLLKAITLFPSGRQGAIYFSFCSDCTKRDLLKPSQGSHRCAECEESQDLRQYIRAQINDPGICVPCIQEYKKNRGIAGWVDLLFKFCSGCEKTLTVTKFCRATRAFDGLFHRCNGCHGMYAKNQKARYRAQNTTAHAEVPETKRCGHCKMILPADAFSRTITNKGMLYSWCKKCRKNDQKRQSQGISQLRKRVAAMAAQLSRCCCGAKDYAVKV